MLASADSKKSFLLGRRSHLLGTTDTFPWPKKEYFGTVRVLRQKAWETLFPGGYFPLAKYTFKLCLSNWSKEEKKLRKRIDHRVVVSASVWYKAGMLSRVWLKLAASSTSLHSSLQINIIPNVITDHSGWVVAHENNPLAAYK